MRRIYSIILFAFVILVACKDEQIIFPEPPARSFIIAGDMDAVGTDYSGIINTSLNCLDFGSHNRFKSFDIDMDDDKEIDFIITASSSGGQGGYSRVLNVKTLNSFCKTAMPSGTSLDIRNLNGGDTIDSNLDWRASEWTHLLTASAGMDFQKDPPEPYYRLSGNWYGVDDGYVGIMKVHETDTLFGWIRLGIIDDYQILIKDYAIR